jgi:hypothetical protein
MESILRTGTAGWGAAVTRISLLERLQSEDVFPGLMGEYSFAGQRLKSTGFFRYQSGKPTPWKLEPGPGG